MPKIQQTLLADDHKHPLLLRHKTNDKSLTNQRSRPYINETGPGQYEIPEIIGHKTVIADKRNGPSFTFGHRTKKMQFISKEYLKVRIRNLTYIELLRKRN